MAWLGFWLKFSFVMAFGNAQFPDATGYFNKSATSYDHALLVATCGAAALILASKAREIFLPLYSKKSESVGLEGIFYYYQKRKKLFWGLFIVLFSTIALTNIYLGIYQRGLPPQVTLPYKLRGVYTWLLLFGLTSFSSIFINFELRNNEKPSMKFIFLTMLESFFSNVSMLSRGMILNMGALFVGFYKRSKLFSTTLNLKYIFVSTILLLSLFFISIVSVNYVRPYFFHGGGSSSSAHVLLIPSDSRWANVINGTTSLFINRWVGIEAAMAVSSFPGIGWNLFKKAWQEEFKDTGTSYYDAKIALMKHDAQELERNHFISLPGIIGFFYYPGSLLFLFFAIFSLGIFASAIEYITYYISGHNLLLCALFSQIVASRYVHFGYAPKQSYLLFGSGFSQSPNHIWFKQIIISF